MSVRPPRIALFIFLSFLLVSSAFSQSALKVAPLPYDPLELSRLVPLTVPLTLRKKRTPCLPESTGTRARQNSAMHTPGMAPFAC